MREAGSWSLLREKRIRHSTQNKSSHRERAAALTLVTVSPAPLELLLFQHFEREKKQRRASLFSVLERVEQRAVMELSSIGDQVFAVESITKKRVRKVSRAFG